MRPAETTVAAEPAPELTYEALVAANAELEAWAQLHAVADALDALAFGQAATQNEPRPRTSAGILAAHDERARDFAAARINRRRRLAGLTPK